jgi:hypothetical protein
MMGDIGRKIAAICVTICADVEIEAHSVEVMQL